MSIEPPFRCPVCLHADLAHGPDGCSREGCGCTAPGVGPYRAGPGGPGVNVDLARAEADCPGCGTTFATLADEPSFPRHYVSPDGRVVIFGG